MVNAPLEAFRLILKTLRPDQTPETWESDRVRAGVSWHDLAVRAIVLGLGPQVHWRLQQWRGAGRVAPEARAAAKLAATYQATAARNASIYLQLGEMMAACDRHGLRPIALKGVHVATALYAEPGLRPMNDIDLLFTPDELPAAEALLESLGYQARRKPAGVGPGVTKHTSTFRRAGAGSEGATPNPFLSADADRTVEPHTSLEESWFGLKVDITPGVRERAVEEVLGGHRCRALSNEDLLLHLCVHFCFHLIMGTPSMVQLADLLALTQARPPAWPQFVERSVARGAAPYALAGLILAHNLVAAPVPASVCARLAESTPRPLLNRVNRLGLADVLRRTQQRPLVSIAQRIRRGFSDRAETARWALDWRGRWRVWQTALNVAGTDTGRLLLGRGQK